MEEIKEEQTTEEQTIEDQAKEKKNTLMDEVISWIKVIGAAVIIAYILGNYILMNAYIPTGSMESTLNIGDRLIGFRLSYLFSEPERYDVVMFKYPDDESQDYIKRVIGLPGEKITIKEGRVYINDSTEPLDEPYLKEGQDATYSWRGDGEFTVPEGCYFMLGDNRDNSKDSRLWNNPYVKKEKILAKAIFRFYPKVSMVKTDYK